MRRTIITISGTLAVSHAGIVIGTLILLMTRRAGWHVGTARYAAYASLAAHAGLVRWLCTLAYAGLALA